jgi:hypothetical protein
METEPNSDRAIIDPSKVARYLLSGTHPIGWAKAQFFKRFGFREDNPSELSTSLLAHVRDNAVAKTEASAFGTKYRVDGPLASPDGRNPHVSTIWIIAEDEAVPSFITAFPC